MIKTRIFQFVGHIHNMQLCIEMISFINHENESILRWFYRFCEPRNFSLCPRNLVGVYSGGLGVWFMTFCCCLVEFGFSCFNHASIESWFANYSVLDILHTPLRSARCLAEDVVERWKNKGRRSRQNTANNKTTPPWQLLYWCRALGYSGYSILEIIVLILRSNFATRFVCFF